MIPILSNGDVLKAKEYTYFVMPLLVAIIKIGDISLSKARFRKEKHSISNM